MNIQSMIGLKIGNIACDAVNIASRQKVDSIENLIYIYISLSHRISGIKTILNILSL
jgi:hypothetical protein